MEFLLVSDIHADEYSKFSTIDPKTGMNSRLFWTVDIFKQIQEYQKELKCPKVLLIGGDVFDKRGVISTPAYDAVYAKLKELEASGWVLFGIVGNHDQATRSGEIHSLKPLPFHTLCDPIGKLELDTGGTLAGVSFTERPRDFLIRLEQAKNEFDPDFYMIHQGVNGAKIAGDEILSRDEVSVLDIRAIVGDEAWVFSGHYHIHQKIDPRFYFIGSSTPKDFGDVTPKGFLHFKNGKVKQIESRAPKFITVEAGDLKSKKEELKGQYLQIRYDKEPPKNLDEVGALGFVAVPDRVSREYIVRSSIDPSNSPIKIIGNYLEDMVEKGVLRDVKAEDAIDYLQYVIGEKTIDQTFGGHEIEIKKIKLQNFMSYESQIVDFEDLKGLISIEGENLDDPSATSNGAGKSLIAESIKWAIFGTTARGVSGDDVINKNKGKNCYVKLYLKIDGIDFKVIRYRKDKEYKNELLVYKAATSGLEQDWLDIRGKSDKETQDVLVRELGIDENTFDNTVFFGHNFTKSFATLSDKNQKFVLENILGIEYFGELFEKAKELRSVAQQAHNEAGRAIDYCRGKFFDAERGLKEAESSFKSFETKRLANIEEQKKVIEKEEDSIATLEDNSKDEAELLRLEDKLEAAKQAKADFFDKKDHLIEIMESCTAKEKELLKSIQKLELAHSNQAYVIEDLLEKAEKLNATSIDKCPACNQVLLDQEKFKEQHDRQIAELASKIDEKVSESEARSSEISKLKKELDKVQHRVCKAKPAWDARDEQYESLNNEIQTIEEAKRKLSNKLESIQRTLSYSKRAIETAKNWIKKFQDEPNPLSSQIKQYERSLVEIQKEHDKQSEILQSAAIKFNIFKFWETAFSDKGTPTQSPIKSYLLDSVVPVLDELSRKYSEILTEGSISVRFNTVTQLKSGEMRDNFNVEVVNKHGAEHYLGDSGGERRKVDLIIMFALHALARIRSGSRFDILVLDEILDSLDYEGCERVINLLREMQEEIRSIFVITHNDNLKTKFSTFLRVRKENGTSCLLP